MRERIARSLYDHREDIVADPGRIFYAGEWDSQVDAVLDAMREPTDEMIAAAFATCHPADLGGDTDPRLTWPAMIDEAKK